MKTLNMNQHSGYPMLQIAKLGEGIIEFCHNESVEIGDRVNIVLRKFQDSYNAEFDISEIVEQRKSKGKHSLKGVNWFKVRVCEPKLFQE
jgi:hypothetical protein